MELKESRPDGVTVNIFINFFAHLDQMNCAFFALAMIFKLVFHPGAIKFNTLIRGLCVMGKVK